MQNDQFFSNIFDSCIQDRQRKNINGVVSWFQYRKEIAPLADACDLRD